MTRQGTPHKPTDREQLTSDDVDELVRDGGLATTVVLHRQTADHVGRVLRRVVHGVAARKRLLRTVQHLLCVNTLTERSARRRAPRQEQRRWRWRE